MLDACIKGDYATAETEVSGLWNTGYSAVDVVGTVFKVCKSYDDKLMPEPLKLAFIRESGHTRMFYHGRTETVRTCSVESVDFVQTMCDANASDGDKFKALKTAVDSHLAQVKDCLMGQGIDRHLMGLQVLAQMSGMQPRPALFTDKAYRVSSSFVLSTSNIGATPMFGGFSPFTEDGIGVCYGIRKDMINFSIVANHNFDATDAATFRDNLTKSLIDMQELCLTRNVMYVGKAKM